MAVLANIRHENFAQQLARGVHVKLAARRAGFLEPASGYGLAARPEVAARVNELLEAAASVAVMESAEILQGLTVMARGDLRDVFNPDAVKRDFTGQTVIDPLTNEPVRTIELLHPNDWTNEAAAAITSLEFDNNGRPKVKTVDKLKAYEMLGRARGMFKDNVSLTGADGGPIQTISADMTPEQAANLYQMTLGK